jgi:hypothetical protein
MSTQQNTMINVLRWQECFWPCVPPEGFQ